MATDDRTPQHDTGTPQGAARTARTRRNHPHGAGRRTHGVGKLAALLGSGALLAAAPLAAALALPTQLADVTPLGVPAAHAEAPGAFSGNLLDAAGVLNPGQAASVNERISQLQQEQNTVVVVAYVNTFDGMDPQDWARQTWQAQGGTPNTAVFAVAVDDRLAGGWAGDDVPTDGQDLVNAAAGALGNDDWAGAATAAIDEATAATAAEGLGVLGAGAAGAAILGGGAYAWSRRNKKKRTETEVAEGRNVRPDDVESLDRLSTDALDELAHEELVSTDESIRLADTELSLAKAEFGDARVRDLEQALNHSRRTLDRAFAIRHKLDHGPRPGESERRAMLLEIISTCGTADDRLDEQTGRYQDMRTQLLNAPNTLDHLTQRAVDLRTRIPQATTQLDGLRARYDEETLASISDNIDMATEDVNMAERSADEARALLAKPAGEQAGLIDALRATDLALDQAERLIEGIEHAEENISQAVAGLEALIAEVRGEIDEATNLLAAPGAANIDRAALAAAVDAGRNALGTAERTGATDPLGAWTELTDADADLDEHLEHARDAANAFHRTMQTLHNALMDARAQVTGARDIIGTRRRMVGSTARTRLAEAERHLHTAEAIAQNPGTGQQNSPRAGIREAREAARLGKAAINAARRDINRHQQQMNYRGGGNSGALVAGLVLGNMMGGGGGFGGGFGGGGGLGGGGFGGGSGGSIRF